MWGQEQCNTLKLWLGNHCLLFSMSAELSCVRTIAGSMAIILSVVVSVDTGCDSSVNDSLSVDAGSGIGVTFNTSKAVG